jgi:hypothetical protein
MMDSTSSPFNQPTFDFSQFKPLIETPPIRFPIAAVARPDVYELLTKLKEFEFKNAPLGFPGSIPVLKDPAAHSIAMAQTDECMLFYDQHSLTLYLNRAEDPIAWVKHCCEEPGIPYPLEENEPGRQFPPDILG